MGHDGSKEKILKASFFKHTLSWKILFFGIQILFVVAVVFDVFLFHKFMGVYREFQCVNIDPASRYMINNRSTGFEVGDECVKITLFGDSRIQYWDPALQVSGCEIINRGIAGNTTSRSLLQIQNHVLDLRPDIVVIQIGINDLKTIGVFPDEKEWILEQCKDNYRILLSMISEAGVHSVVTTIFPPAHPSILRKPVWSNDIEAAVLEMNEWIRTLNGSRITVLDCDTLLQEKGRVKKHFYRDTLHLNENGYEFLNREVEKVLEEIINQKKMEEHIDAVQ